MIFLILLCTVICSQVCGKNFICPYEISNSCRCTSPSSETFEVNCANSGLTRVPKSLPIETTHLILDDNKIELLEKGSLPNNLRNFSLKNNQLHNIILGAFGNVPQLEELNLFNNTLRSKYSLHDDVFAPLSKSLKVLDMRLNRERSTDYPKAVGKLNSLIELKLDYVHAAKLPLEYVNMKQLQKLFLHGNGHGYSYIKNDTFYSLSQSNLSEIYLNNLNLGGIDADTFSKFKFLRRVDLSNNPELKEFGLTQVASSLRNSQVKVLNLNNVGLLTETVKVLSKFCYLPLEELTFDNNSLEPYDWGVSFDMCFPNLRVLSLKSNLLLGGMNHYLKSILKLKHIVGLDLSYQWHTTTGKYKHSVKRSFSFCTKGTACPIVIPPTLEWFDISHNGLQTVDLPEVAIMNIISLKRLYASYGGIETIAKPVYCRIDLHVVPTIELLDLSNNKLKCLTSILFEKNITHCDWASLKTLYLSNNKLGNIQGNSCNKDKDNIFGFLQPLVNLETLDISNNQVKSSGKLVQLENLKSLKELDLSSNQFLNISLNMENMTNLENLNLSNNNLTCLSMPFQNQLDRMNVNSRRIKVDLSGNLLSCSCECYEFFKWTESTQTVLEGKQSYICEFYDKERVKLTRLSYILSKLETNCFGLLWLKIYISTICEVYLMITIVSLIYRFRHTIWFLYIQSKLKRINLTKLLNRGKYTFNAFVSCHHTDAKFFVKRKLLPELEGKKNLNLCVSQRDFIVGVTIVDNIVRAMKKSRKIVVIVSRFFLQSGWCKEELKIAQQESIDRGENIIICIFMPDIKPKDLPPTLRMIVKNVTCMKWCPDPVTHGVFWLMLQKGLIEGEEVNVDDLTFRNSII